MEKNKPLNEKNAAEAPARPNRKAENAPYDYLIVGAGLFGAVFAREMRRAGRRCLVVDRRTTVGGNLYCRDVEGIAVHEYGAHIFHTDNREVWDYVNGLVEFNRYTNCPVARYKGRLYNLPFNMNTFCRLWDVTTPAEAMRKIEEQRAEFAGIGTPANLEEQALKLCGRDIYETLIKGYTEKQWGRAATELPAFIIRRVPLRFTFDNNYFNDRYQGIPVGGYNPLIAALLQGTEVRTGTDFTAHRAELEPLARRVLFTGCIDEYFDYRLGRLDYRSLRFEHHRENVANRQGVAVMNHTDRDVPYTRSIEHKHFEPGAHDDLPLTVVTHEYPADFAPGREPYYPVNDARNTALYARYRELADRTPGVRFGGRLGQYIYADMDDTVAAALDAVRQELGGQPATPSGIQ